MPFRSVAQMRACFARHDPRWDCRAWLKETPWLKRKKKKMKTGGGLGEKSLDQKWLRHAIRANKLEVQAARKIKSQSFLQSFAEKEFKIQSFAEKEFKIQSFAENMIRDHSAALVQLRRRLTLVTKELEPTLKDKMMLRTLTEEKYVKFAVRSHRQALHLYTKEIQTGQDPQIRTLAKAQIKVVRKHLRHALHLKNSF